MVQHGTAGTYKWALTTVCAACIYWHELKQSYLSLLLLCYALDTNKMRIVYSDEELGRMCGCQDNVLLLHVGKKLCYYEINKVA